MYSELKEIIGQAWENRELLAEASVQEAIREVIPPTPNRAGGR